MICSVRKTDSSLFVSWSDEGRSQAKIFDRSVDNYAAIEAAALAKDFNAFKRAITRVIPLKVIAKIDGFEVTDTEILHNGVKLESVLVGRVIEMVKAGESVKPILNFMARLEKNPSYRSRRELLTWLQDRKLPITEEGLVLGYKAVSVDYFSVHAGPASQVMIEGTRNSSGHILNTVGSRIRIERAAVNDDCTVGCSEGLHVGTLEYARSFHRGRLLIVEFDPADVVSVPTDCDYQKLRCCAYTVIGEYVEELPQVLPIEPVDYRGADTCSEDLINMELDDCDDIDIDFIKQEAYEAGRRQAFSEIVLYGRKQSLKQD